jgi:HK97 family phage prohead protease
MSNSNKRKQFVATVSAVPNHRGDEPEMLVSTSTPDRDGDRVIPAGVDVSNFKKNPILLWAHDYTGIPVGAVTGLEQTGEGWRARWRWNESDDFAQRVKRGWDEGFIRAASIGFLPRKVVGNDHGGYDFVQSELLEISLVPVPANGEAVRQLKQLGLWGNTAPCATRADLGD